VTRLFRSLFRRLTGPTGRRLIVLLVVVCLWIGWVYAPTWPIVTWRRPEGKPIQQVLLSPNGSCFLALEYIHSWHLLSLADGRELAASDDPTCDWLDSRFGPDGSWLAMQDPSGVISLRDTADGRTRLELLPPGGRSPDRASAMRRSFAISPDGRVLAVQRDDGWPKVLQLWDVATGRALGTVDRAGQPFVFAPDGRTLAAVHFGEEGDPIKLKLWDVASGRELARFGDIAFARPGAVAFSPDGRRLAAGLRLAGGIPGPRPKDVTIWDRPADKVAVTLPVEAPTYQVPFWFDHAGLEFGPDGRFLVARTRGTGLFWDLAADPPRCRDDLLADTRRSPGPGAPDYPTPVAYPYPLFTKDGMRFLVPGPEPHTFVIYDAAALTPLATVGPGPSGPAGRIGEWSNAPVLSADGRRLAIGANTYFTPMTRVEAWLTQMLGRPVFFPGRHGEVRLYDLATGADAGRLPADGRVLGFAPDGRTLWTYAEKPGAAFNQPVLEVCQWAVPTGRPPAWLFTVTGVGLLLIAADWRRGRRHISLEALP
jgi:WD40 repeat protein